MDKKDLLNKGILQRTIINSETAIKPYYYVRNKLLHVRYTVDRAIRLSDTEEGRIKQEITEFPSKKQEILETNWNFLEKNVRKSIILDGIAELSKRIKGNKNG